MKAVYEFITKANQVLLFLVIVGGAGWISYLVYAEASRNYEPPHGSVVQTPDEKGKNIVDDVRFLGLSSEVYMFGVVKRVVAPDEDLSVMIRRVDYLGEYRESGEIVNVVFVKGEQLNETIQCLSSDGEHGVEEFQVDMEHLYHHLNTAWNGRDQTDEQHRQCTDADFARFRRFPKEDEFAHLET